MIQMDLSHIRQFIPLPYEEARAAQLRLADRRLTRLEHQGAVITGSHRHRRLLSGRTGRHRVPVLPQL